MYDGSVLGPDNVDVTFFIDPSASTVNIDGQSVFRTTVETIDNPSAQVDAQVTPTPTPSPTVTT